MSFPQAVERWRAKAQAELARQHVPLPVELVLSVIQGESGGSPESESHVGAMGLMQVMPGTLRWYNEKNRTNYTDAQFKSNPDLQIRVGLWVLKHYWKSAYRYLSGRTQNIGIELLSKAANLFYVFGPGRAQRLWNMTSPTFEAFAARHPNTDPIRRKYAVKIWDRLTSAGAQWQTDTINEWLGGGDTLDPDPDPQKEKTGAIIVVLAIAAAWWFFKKGKL